MKKILFLTLTFILTFSLLVGCIVIDKTGLKTPEQIIASAASKTSTKDITSFSFTINGAVFQAVISGTSITVTLTNGTDVTALTPNFVTTGKLVDVSGTFQTSGITSNNFTSSKTYVVTAEDWTTKSYTVTVNVAATTKTWGNSALKWGDGGLTWGN